MWCEEPYPFVTVMHETQSNEVIMASPIALWSVSSTILRKITFARPHPHSRHISCTHIKIASKATLALKLADGLEKILT